MLPLHVLVPADIRNCVMDMAAAENVSTAEVVRDLLSTAITARGTNGGKLMVTACWRCKQ